MFRTPPLGRAPRTAFFSSNIIVALLCPARGASKPSRHRAKQWHTRLGLEELDQRWLPSAATHYSLSTISLTPPPGVSFSVTVRALDDSGRIDPSYIGTVHFTTTDLTAIVASDYTFTSNNLGMVTISGFVAGSNGQTITGRDTNRPSITGTLQTGVATVAGNGGSNLIGPAGVLPGTPFDLTAEIGPGTPDPNAPPYLGTIHFTSTDPLASLPDDYTFTLADFLGGGVSSHTFHGVVLNTLGRQTISVTDNLNTNIHPLHTSVGTYFNITLGNVAQAGQSGTFVVSAMLLQGLQPNYLGTVHFTCTDPLASLPHDYTFKPNDNGVHQFTITYRTSGDQLLQVNDTATPAYQGSQYTSISPAAASDFVIAAPSTVSASSSFAIKVFPIDRFNNLATDYQGTVHFDSSDQGALLPSDYTLSKGEGAHTFTVSGLRPSPHTLLRVSDSFDPSIAGNASLEVIDGSPFSPLRLGRTKPVLAPSYLAEIERLLAETLLPTDKLFALYPAIH